MPEAPDLAAAIAAVGCATQMLINKRWRALDQQDADREIASLRRAQRVLEALAEEPTPDMIEAVDNLQTDENGEPCPMQAAAVWRAMRAALLAQAGGAG